MTVSTARSSVERLSCDEQGRLVELMRIRLIEEDLPLTQPA
ncbi:hypothetical protein [Streptosporangium sp. CA-115845]